MSKFDVAGDGAGAFLDRLSTASVDGDPGVITYTQWLNERGTIEADLTVTERADDHCMVVATDTAHRHVETWMRRRAPESVRITDVSAELAQINLQGPNSREILQRVTDADVSNEAFGFRSARRIEIGGIEVLCIRITYVGELGQETDGPAAGGGTGPRHPWGAGQDLRLRPAA